ncbi:hypothetical protein Tsubulata_051373 [Turnera subulata]|uniref:Uncharacterized protein n=1 Tax=Turnera subulata TaxID=218843 RepID=A0A9Q0EY19_9ROSI|nr:hypothetical protein Tsubulata_051373 [Turnera subulata]
MNVYGEDNSSCYFHPKEVGGGVCPQCLNERLLILAAKQGHLPSSKGTHKTHHHQHLNFPKIFALSSLLNRLEFRHSKSVKSDDHDASSSSQEGSFISIKFEDNGVASWEKGALSSNNKVSFEQFSKAWNHDLDKNSKQQQEADKKMKERSMSVIEHAKPRASLRWQKRIGHVFQLIRWKRSNKGNVCHVGTKVEGVKVRKSSWIRILTKRRTKE